MNKSPESHDRLLDDRLSEFTDLLLSSEDEVIMQEAVNDMDLAELKRTAILMKTATRIARPNSTVSARVRSRLLWEWKQQSKQPKRSAFIRNLFEPALFPRFAMVGGLIVLLLLSVVTLIVPVSPPLTGAAVVKLQAWAPWFILLGIVLIIVLFWFDRRQ